MSWKKSRVFLVAGALLLGVGDAQAGDVRWNVAGPATWNNDANWVVDTPSGPQNFKPEAAFDDTARVNNGGTANLDATVPDILGLFVQNGRLNVVSGGNLNVIAGAGLNGDATVSGTVHFDGNSGFSLDVAGNLNSSGTLSYNIGAPSSTAFNWGIDGDVTLGGTASLTLSSGPAFGDSWDLVTAGGSLSGGFNNVVSNQPLAKGLQYQAVVNGNTAGVQVGNTLVATVNRDTGNIQVDNTVGGDIEIKGYSIQSANGLLDPAGWNSLTAQGAADFREANPQATGLSELSLLGSTTIAVGANRNLGAGFNSSAGASPRDEDLALTFVTADGNIKTGIVEYTGDANDLVLKINDTGAAQLENIGNGFHDVTITGIDIVSASGSLTPGSYTGLGGGFTIANPTANSIGDLNLEGELLVENESVMALGGLFNTGGTRDVEFRYSTSAGDVLLGHVEYGDFGTPDGTTTRLAADFNNDGMVGLADFDILKNNFGGPGDENTGDATDDGQVGLADFDVLKSTFGNVAAVPEPSTVVLALLGALGLIGFARRK